MRLGAKIEHPEVRPSMESFRFDAVPDQGNQPLRSGDLRRSKNRELQVKVEELERLYAAHFKIRLSEKSLEGESLVRMVDVPENQMNLREAEIRKGRAYCRYAEKRDAKLSAERGWKRREMEMLENMFEESWAQMKARRSQICDAKSEKHEILKYAGEEDNRLATAASENKVPEESFQLCSSNIIHASQSCVHVVSSYADSFVHAPTGNPVTGTTLHQTMIQEGDSTQVRRKWEITEKPKIASNNFDKLLKDVAKQFKKLLKFERNGKNAEDVILDAQVDVQAQEVVKLEATILGVPDETNYRATWDPGNMLEAAIFGAPASTTF